MLTGQYVGLRAIEESDLDPLRQWRNRPEYRQYFREYREISALEQQRWYEREVIGNPRTRMFAIVDKTNDQLLGACGLCYIDPVRRSADFSIYIGAHNLYIDDQFAPDAGKVLIEYGFHELNLHRIWAEIYDIDIAKQNFLPKLGFKLDGRLRDAHFTGGKWCSSFMYSILDDEYSGWNTR